MDLETIPGILGDRQEYSLDKNMNKIQLSVHLYKMDLKANDAISWQ